MQLPCCTTREDPDTPRRPLSQPPRNQPPPAQVRELSPVSAYVNAELDPNERRIYFQLQARNRELRWQLGACGDVMGSAPAVEQQVALHLDRLRFELAEGQRLRGDLGRLQEALARVESGRSDAWDVPPSAGAMFPGAEREEAVDHQRLAAAVMAEIQQITQANIELISGYDEQVKALEAQLVAEKRRRQNAELELRMPPSMRSLSQLRSQGNLGPASPPPQEAPSREQQDQLARLEAECASLAAELAELGADQQAFEVRTLQELRTAHELQEEELEHFRKLLQEKRAGGSEPPEHATNALALLEAELEQLGEHLGHTKAKGEQERQNAEQLAAQLRLETQQMQQELESIAAAKQQCLLDLEEAKRASWSAERPSGETRPPNEAPQAGQGAGMNSQLTA